MPKPSLKLIILSLLLAPTTILAAATEEGRLLCLSLYLMLAIASALDLLLTTPPRSLKTFVLKQVRQSKNTPGKFDLYLEFPEGVKIPGWILVGVPFPPPIEPKEDEQRFALKADRRTYKTTWEFNSPSRGLFAVEKIFWQIQSKFGLWLIRGASPIDLSIRIHPDIRREKKALANLFMNRGLAGLKLQKTIGQGRDYDQIRDYQAGDSLLDIHWKASAKRNSLMAKTYQVERTQDVYVLIDHSRLSARRIQTDADEFQESVLERFIAATNVLALAATRQGDNIGTAAFARYPTNFIRAGAGPAHLKAIQNSIFNLRPTHVSPDFDELMTFCRLRIRRRSLVIILTDLSDPAVYESFYHKVDLISRRHLVLVNMVTMAGVQPLFGAHQTSEIDIYQELAGHLLWKDLNDYRRLFSRKRVTLQLLKSENLAVEMVNQYLNIKQRQLI